MNKNKTTETVTFESYAIYNLDKNNFKGRFSDRSPRSVLSLIARSLANVIRRTAVLERRRAKHFTECMLMTSSRRNLILSQKRLQLLMRSL